MNLNRNKMKVKLREAKMSDCQLLFLWANDPEVRKNAFNTDPIPWKDHFKWFTTKMDSADTKIFILEKDATPVGQVRFDRVKDFWKISYSIDEKYRGMGMGKKIVKLGINEFKGKIRAWVKTGNDASTKIFDNLGFQKEIEDSGTIQYYLSK